MRTRAVVLSLSLLALAVPSAAGAAVPNDPRVGDQWAVNNTGQTVRGVTGVAGVDAGLARAWDFVTGGEVVVAVADSGVALDHPDLQANVWANPGETGTDAQGRDRRTNGLDDDANGRVDDWRGWDFLSNDNNPADENGRGTALAGIVGAVGSNGTGTAGVAWRTRLMALRVGSSSPQDSSINLDALAASIAYAGAKGAKVFVSSVVGANPSTAVDDAIAANPQMLFVFAAGGSGADVDATRTYPCAFNRANVICTTAITNQGVLPPSANRGATTVDLGAPGAAVLTTSLFSTKLDEPFETAIDGRWSRAGGTTVLNWGVSTSPRGDGSKALTINANSSPVASSTTSAIKSGRVDLAGCVNPLLRATLSTGYTNGFFDVAVTDNADGDAAVSWVPVLRASGTQQAQTAVADLTKVDTNGDTVPDKDYTGKNIAVVLASVTGAAENGRGPAVDSLEVLCRPNVYTGQELTYLDGTGAAAAQVAGVAALVASQYAAADATYLRNAILGTTTPMPSLAAVTVTGGRLNALGAIDTVPPAAFVATAPADGATTVDARPVFTFPGTTDDRTGIARYDLVVDGAVVATAGGAARALQPSAPLAAGKHTWRIDAVDGAGLRTSTPARTVAVETGDPVAPTIKASAAKKVTNASVAAKGLTVSCDLGEAGRCAAEVRISKRDATRLGLEVKGKTLLVAKAAKATAANGEVRLKLKPSKKVRAALKRIAASVRFTITVTATDAAGNEAKPRKLTVKS